jgi:hypothetical protein
MYDKAFPGLRRHFLVVAAVLGDTAGTIIMEDLFCSTFLAGSRFEGYEAGGRRRTKCGMPSSPLGESTRTRGHLHEWGALAAHYVRTM